MEQLREPGAVILDEIAGLETARARLESRIAQRSLDFADLRRRESESADTAAIGGLQASFAADELALVLMQPTRTVQCRLAEARRVRGLLPQTWLAFHDGEIDGTNQDVVGKIHCSAAATLPATRPGAHRPVRRSRSPSR